MANQLAAISDASRAQPVTARPARSDALAGIQADFEERATQENAKKIGMPYVAIRLAPISADAVLTLPAELKLRAAVLPYSRHGREIRLAVAEPESVLTQHAVEKLQAANYSVITELASRSGILARLEELRTRIPEQQPKTPAASSTIDPNLASLAELADQAGKTSAGDLLNKILTGALAARASDLHLQSEEADLAIRFRIDGLLREVARLPKKYGQELIDQVKYSARLHLNIRDLPQDGRAEFSAGNRQVDLRISTLPTKKGESLVCRLLDRNHKNVGLAELGFGGQTLARLSRAPSWANGLILLTGPTGSGKTTTLYSLLELLNSPDKKIATLEDPVEYEVPGIVQSQIDEEHGFSFADGLRSLLRQDPDIVLVGEIRDRETAEVALQAALTGHLVLSTLHTNSAIEALPRLLNLGLPPYLIAHALKLVVAQRLIRKLDPSTAVSAESDGATVELLKKGFDSIRAVDPEALPFEANPLLGNDFAGRSVIAESLEMTDEIRRLVLAGADSLEFASAARREQKMLTLAQDGLLRVARGETTLAELARVVDLSELDSETTSPSHAA